MRGDAAVTTLAPAGLPRWRPRPRSTASPAPRRATCRPAIKLAYLEAGLDYRLAVVEARQEGGAATGDGLIELPAAVAQDQAQKRAQVVLQEAWAGARASSWPCRRPPGAGAGRCAELQLDDGPYLLRIEEVADGSLRKIRGRSFDPAVQQPADAPARGEAAETAVVYGPPAVQVMDLPLAEGLELPHAPWIAAAASPWPGALSLNRRTGAAALAFDREIDSAATMGVLVTPLAAGPLDCFDRGTAVTVRLVSGAVFSIGMDALLQGGQAAAIGSMATGWESCSSRAAELVAAQTWRLSLLLRGQSGSGPEMRALRPAGERFVLLDAAVVQPTLSLAQAGLEQSWQLGPAQYDLAAPRPASTLRSAHAGPAPAVAGAARRDAAGGGRRGQLDQAQPARRRQLGAGRGAAGRGARGLSRRGAAGRAGEAQRDGECAVPGSTARPTSLPTSARAHQHFTLRVAQLSGSFGAGAPLQETIHV